MVYDPEDGSRLALEVAYSLARARVLMAKGGVEGLDAPALRAEVERALGAMDEVRRIKLHLTNAAGGIEQARSVLEGMAERVRAHLAQIGALVDAAAPRSRRTAASKGVGSVSRGGVVYECVHPQRSLRDHPRVRTPPLMPGVRHAAMNASCC